ncbi:MAG: 4-hydroxy-3-methylbut-2-en-1-yl diphosphate synthase [Planctomycetes bacterium DG_23]|nr:MAG: 4-hydroxy-3-methylbut-2-en-1-yl diphosphate synthase [Planctomycetes bacterium DG_23]
MIARRKTRKVQVAAVSIGGDSPISVQGMTKTRTEDTKATVRQIEELAEVGCEIVRVAVPTRVAARALKKIKAQISLPLVADIHYSPTLALMAIEAGVDKIRINPGNIRKPEAQKKIVLAAKKHKIPIRIGVNSGSVLPRKGLKVMRPAEEQNLAVLMVELVLKAAHFFESLDFGDIVISLKASDPIVTIRAYRLAAMKCDYPFHLGVTATGPAEESMAKSAIGIGTLLAEGIGDTIRVSTTGPPQLEIKTAYDILAALGIRRHSPEIISCPVCGRCEVDLPKIVGEVKEALAHEKRPLKIAVMGCVVNGPGEAAEADLGIACTKDYGFIFKKGEILRRVSENALMNEFLQELRELE